MKIAAFTGSETISSRRFRVLQYVKCLADHGIDVTEFVAKYGSWPPAQTWKRPFWLAATLGNRIGPALASHHYDLTLLQREFASTLYTLERFTGRPRILDVDDAVWLNGERAYRNFAKLARSCDGVICGNDYIASVVGQWNAKTIVLPTAVDTDRFAIGTAVAGRRKIIGWSGLYAGSKYLLGVEDALFNILQTRDDVVLRVVSDAPPNFRLLRESMVEYIQWTPENEVRTIQEMDVGLMPIADDEWSKGKCSYKMLLYMSCGIPVVVSPYGMNKDILDRGDIGYGPNSLDEWHDALIGLLDDHDARTRMGNNARAIVEAEYSLKKIGPKLANFLLSFQNI